MSRCLFTIRDCLKTFFRKVVLSLKKIMHLELCQVLLLGSSHVDPLESIQTEMLNGPPNTQESYFSPWYMSAHAAELPCTALLSWAKVDGPEVCDGFSHNLQSSLLQVNVWAAACH